MKKGSLIIGGIVILALLVGVWVYLLFFGTPKNSDEVFANLGFGGGSVERDELPEIEQEPAEEVQPPVILKPLRQLTLRPVAGFFVPKTALPSYIRFVERGTGHIYQVDLATGQEIQATKVTSPQVVEAVFSPEGTSVIMATYVKDTKSSNLMLLAHPTGETEVTEIIPLPPNAENLAYQNETSILYTLSDSKGTTGYRYHVDSKTQIELFRVPLTQVRMVWGDGIDSMYLYTKPSRFFEGYVYRVENNQLLRLVNGQNGLVYERNNVAEIVTSAGLSDITSRTKSATGTIETPVVLLPEKCAFAGTEGTQLWCGADVSDVPPTYLESWYRGETTSNDALWSIEAQTGEMALVSNLALESGRAIDVTNTTVSVDGLKVFFSNKLDGTVWLYDSLIAAGINI